MLKKIGKFLSRIGLHKRITEIRDDPDFPGVKYNGYWPLSIVTEKCRRCGKIFSVWTAPPKHPNCNCQPE